MRTDSRKAQLTTTGKNQVDFESVTPSQSYLQFSKKPIMENFGELPFGEIPEPLKYVRNFRKN